jgi:hypothetical protein
MEPVVDAPLLVAAAGQAHGSGWDLAGGAAEASSWDELSLRALVDQAVSRDEVTPLVRGERGGGDKLSEPGADTANTASALPSHATRSGLAMWGDGSRSGLF